MSDHFTLTLAQLNPTVGDFAGNMAKALHAWDQGQGAAADMVMLPEMFITGYQVQDLVQKPAFIQQAMAAIDTLAQRT
ncbi:MAG: nitrilase-related carbon-nitrogen hydrolase, partial [Pseudomonadota bacterium]